jgi:alpha-mannosidase/mannosylglycerate hydrolase
VGRGTNEDTHPAQFVWQSPDGSRALTVKLQDNMGYGALTSVYSGRTSSAQPSLRTRPPRRRRDANGNVVDYLESPAVDEALRAYVEHEMGRTRLGLLVLMDALDHRPILALAPELLERIRQLFPDVDVVHSSLPAVAAAMRKQAGEMPVFSGELRDTARAPGGYNYLISNCLSSRYPIKQANDAGQTLLERWAEPYLLWANLMGERHLPTSYLDVAWHYTLQNHAHDSICGCSLDQVHKDMGYRSDQTRQIGDAVVAKALRRLIPDDQVELSDVASFQVALAQAEPYARREVVVFDIAFAPEWDQRFHEGFNGEAKNSFRLYDAAGQEQPYQLLAVKRNRTMTKESPDSIVNIIKRDIHTVAAEAALPPLGYTTLEVRPASGPTRIWGTLRTGPLSAENEHLAISINPNGALRLTDKATQRAYDQLLTFVDDGEVGDGWFHVAPIDDEVVTSAAAPCDTGVAADGPLMVTFRLRTRLQVPHAFDWAAARRSQQRDVLVITSDVTLKKGSRAIEVKTTVQNTIKDHRLRVLLPTGLKTDTWWVDLAFDLVERRIALDPASVDNKELSVPEKNMLAVAALAEANAGLGFVAGGGLHEAAAHDDGPRTLAVTLLRAFHRPVATDGQIGGQILGEHVFNYAIAPIAGSSDLTRLLALRDQLATGVRVRQTDAGYGVLERTASLLAVAPDDVRLSACKPAADGRGAIVRLYNPLAAGKMATVTAGFAIKSALLTNASEEGGEPLAVEGNAVKVAVPAKKIVTVRLLT